MRFRYWVALVTFCSATFVVTNATAADPSPQSAIEWRWRRFQAWEYAATAAALGAGFTLRFGLDPRQSNWTGGILFDDWSEQHVVLRDADARERVARLTDYAFYGAMGYRFFDSVITPALILGNGQTALQMSMIDLESFGLVAITLWGTQALLARERPEYAYCEQANPPPDCQYTSAERNRSFFAGHPAIGMTAAGLTCVHHSHLPLYGGGAADGLACGLMVGAAVANGVGRVATQNHYATDLAVGFGVGAFAGFVLPELLHYDHAEPRLPSTSTDRPGLAVRATLVPIVGSDRLGLGVRGVF